MREDNGCKSGVRGQGPGGQQSDGMGNEAVGSVPPPGGLVPFNSTWDPLRPAG